MCHAWNGGATCATRTTEPGVNPATLLTRELSRSAGCAPTVNAKPSARAVSAPATNPCSESTRNAIHPVVVARANRRVLSLARRLARTYIRSPPFSKNAFAEYARYAFGRKLPNVDWNCCHDSTGSARCNGPLCAMPTKAAMSVRISAIAWLACQRSQNRRPVWRTSAYSWFLLTKRARSVRGRFLCSRWPRRCWWHSWPGLPICRSSRFQNSIAIRRCVVRPAARWRRCAGPQRH